jgi:predicted AAA+ superfamily ATPase
MAASSRYKPRVVDEEFRALLDGGVRAVAIEGAKAVGKTATALQRARTVWELDDPERRDVAVADPRRLVEGPYPVLIDEWQRVPASWDLVRREADRLEAEGTYILTGSASPSRLGPGEDTAPMHSGALRIVAIRMRPMSLIERGIATPAVSLAELLSGARPAITGHTDVRLRDYVDEILLSGFPGLRFRDLTPRARRAQLDGYVARIIDRDFQEMGHAVRNPAGLRRWLTAYAAASSTTASYETIRDAATGGEGEKPTRKATQPYRDVLERLWVVDPVPGWLPTRNPIAELSVGPKHQLVDPALAARLLGVNADALLRGDPVAPAIPRDGALLGGLFESLVTNDVRVYAQAAEAEPVSHLRVHRGEHEVDLIVPRADGKVLALEVKTTTTPGDNDVRHLKWLAGEIEDDLLDAVVVTTGGDAYRRRDGIAVVPAALLGP